MSLTIECPSCGRTRTVRMRDVGKRATCSCGKAFLVSNETEEKMTQHDRTNNASKERRIESTEQQTVIRSASSWLDDFDHYQKFTRASDWKAISKINGVPLDRWGTRKEIRRLPDFLEPSETVFALTSGAMKQSVTSNSSDSGWNTWLVALTSERFLFLDAALLTSSIDSQSIRHERVQAVSASQGWLLGKIMVDLGSRVVTVDNCQKAAVKVMADLANKWLQELSRRRDSRWTPTIKTESESPLDRLERLKQLHATGALTDEEFRIGKQKILSDL